MLMRPKRVLLSQGNFIILPQQLAPSLAVTLLSCCLQRCYQQHLLAVTDYYHLCYWHQQVDLGFAAPPLRHSLLQHRSAAAAAVDLKAVEVVRWLALFTMVMAWPVTTWVPCWRWQPGQLRCLQPLHRLGLLRRVGHRLRCYPDWPR